MTRPGPQPGALAPAFRLPDQSGAMHALSDNKGKWQALFFFPKDFTPGCTAEVCSFRDQYSFYREFDIQLLGISLDSGERHRQFSEQLSLPFPLLSDISGEVARAYGVLFSFGPLRFAKRRTFVISPEGNIAAILRVQRYHSHPNDVLMEIERQRSLRTN